MICRLISDAKDKPMGCSVLVTAFIKPDLVITEKGISDEVIAANEFVLVKLYTLITNTDNPEYNEDETKDIGKYAKNC